jgi:Zn-dependent oligopeptidase
MHHTHNIIGLAQEVILYTTSVLDSVAASISSTQTWANVLGALCSVERITATFESIITFPKDVSGDKAIRDVSTEMATVLADFQVTCGLRKDVFDAVQKYSETKEAQRYGRAVFVCCSG